MFDLHFAKRKTPIYPKGINKSRNVTAHNQNVTWGYFVKHK